MPRARRSGAVAGIQLGHCGRKAGLQKWWEGHGPLGAKDVARGEGPWPTIGPSPLPVDDHYRVPEAPDTDGVAQTVTVNGMVAVQIKSTGVVNIDGCDLFMDPDAPTTDATPRKQSPPPC